MKIVPSIRQMQWWFRSRESNQLNFKSYLLIIALVAAIIGFVLGGAYLALEDKSLHLGRTSKVFNWVYGKPLRNLESNREFVARRKLLTDLVNSLQLRDTLPDIIVPAGNFRDSGRLKRSMFGLEHPKVFPEIITFSKLKDTVSRRDKPLTKYERAVFNGFAAYVQQLFREHEDKKDSGHVEWTLATILGLGATDSNSNHASPFNVPWIYIASSQGAIAVYPGTTLIANWNIEARPWFQAAFGTDNMNLKAEIKENDLLTYPYLDLLSQRALLVRTYMYEFSKGEGQEKFVVCIDLHQRGDETSGLMPEIKGLDASYGDLFLKHLTELSITPAHYVAFGIALGILLLLSYVGSRRSTHIYFRRVAFVHGRVNTMQSMEFDSSSETLKHYSSELRLNSRVATGKSTTELRNSILRRLTNVAGTEVKKMRGLELWDIYERERFVWRFIGKSFETLNPTYIGTARLQYASTIFPLVDWLEFKEETFSIEQADAYRLKLLGILQKNADAVEKHLEVPRELNFQNARFPRLPDWVRGVVDTKELLAVRQRRAYVTLSSEQVDELFSKADIRAVMASGYFEQLIKGDGVDWLNKGKTIYRIISFASENVKLTVDPRSANALRELSAIYNSASSRTLRRVNIPILDGSTLLPVYDFAIINDSALVVAHSIARATDIDVPSGRPTKTTYYVQGYLSWRPADIKFYTDIFEDLAEKSMPFVFEDE